MNPQPDTPRVLHIGKYFPPVAGGIETFLGDLLDASHTAGLPVAALVHQPTDHPLPLSSRPYPLFRVPAYGQLLYAPLSPGLLPALHRAIRDFQPHVLHLHCPNVSAFAALSLPAARRLPWVIHWHADVVASKLDRRLAWLYPLYRPLERRLLDRAETIIATSDAYLIGSDALTEHRERCRVIPLGLAIERLREPEPAARDRARGHWPTTGLRLLAIGRLAYYKGFEVLLRALPEVPDAALVIAGEGPQRPILERLMTQLSIRDRTRLTGFVPDPQLQALLAECDILCLPSVERTEAFGMVLLEAMRYAKPVIASDIAGSGVAWVVKQGGHGLLVPPGDSNALATAIRQLQGDCAQRTRLGRSGAQRLSERFHIDRVVNDLQALYRRLSSAAG